MRQPVGVVRLGVRPPRGDGLIERAAAAARDADAAIVVVGTNEDWETEGADRTTIALPGDQDELVRAVAAVNPRTIVVVNAGAPVAMPWVDEVAAILIPFFGGMEMGDAVADVLLGDTDPGGRLPITYPKRLEDAPAWPHYQPVEGVQRYGEGFAMGYRGHDRSGVAPLFPFGHGLSYGDATWGPATASTTLGRRGRDGHRHRAGHRDEHARRDRRRPGLRGAHRPAGRPGAQGVAHLVEGRRSRRDDASTCRSTFDPGRLPPVGHDDGRLGRRPGSVRPRRRRVGNRHPIDRPGRRDMKRRPPDR